MRKHQEARSKKQATYLSPCVHYNYKTSRDLWPGEVFWVWWSRGERPRTPIGVRHNWKSRFAVTEVWPCLITKAVFCEVRKVSWLSPHRPPQPLLCIQGRRLSGFKTTCPVQSALLSRMNTGPHMLRNIDAPSTRQGGVYSQADHAWNTVDNQLHGFVLQEQYFPIKPDEYALTAKAFLYT